MGYEMIVEIVIRKERDPSNLVDEMCLLERMKRMRQV